MLPSINIKINDLHGEFQTYQVLSQFGESRGEILRGCTNWVNTFNSGATLNFIGPSISPATLQDIKTRFGLLKGALEGKTTMPDIYNQLGEINAIFEKIVNPPKQPSEKPLVEASVERKADKKQSEADVKLEKRKAAFESLFSEQLKALEIIKKLEGLEKVIAINAVMKEMSKTLTFIGRFANSKIRSAYFVKNERDFQFKSDAGKEFNRIFNDYQQPITKMVKSTPVEKLKEICGDFDQTALMKEIKNRFCSDAEESEALKQYAN